MSSFDLFLSYHGSDRPLVDEVRRQLKDRSVSSFVDYLNLDAGLPWPQMLEQAISGVNGIVVFVGKETGAWQKREISFALDLQAEAEDKGRKLPVIPVLLPGADLSSRFLFLNQWVDIRQGLTSESIDRLVAAVHGEAQPDIDDKLAELSPYRELQAFDEAHSGFFFGREKLSQRLLERVCEDQGLIAVIGPSGSGKSSLVYAGLLPLLRRQRPPRKAWDAVWFRPGAQPFTGLARVLIPLLEPSMSEVDRARELVNLEDGFRTGKVRLADIAHTIIRKSGGTDRLLVIVDQFEELLTGAVQRGTVNRPTAPQPADPNNIAVSFINMMLGAIASKAPLEFVLTLRADFYGDVLELSHDLSSLFEKCVVNVGPMTVPELQTAIVMPAKKVGLKFEPGLVNRLLNDLGNEPGQLPLLQFSLWQLWNNREGTTMTHAAYEKFGGATKAINSFASAQLNKLSPEELATVRRIFLRLVHVASRLDGGETRQPVFLSELGVAARPLVDQLADARLLVTSGDKDTGEERVEISHEALIREWAELRKWLDEDREFLLWLQRLRNSLTEWHRLERDEGALLRGALLTEAERWRNLRETDLNDDERDYIDASSARRKKDILEEEQRRLREEERRKEEEERIQAEKEQRRQEEERRRRYSRNRAFVLTIVLILGTWGSFEWYRAIRIDHARTLLSPALVIANSEPSRFDQAALLAIESLRLDDTAAAQSVLRQAVSLLPQEIGQPILIPCDGDGALSSHGQYVACIDKTRRSANAISADSKSIGTRFKADQEISMATASDNGRFLAVGLSNAGYRLMDQQTGKVFTCESETGKESPQKSAGSDKASTSAVAFSAKGDRFAAAVLYEKGTEQNEYIRVVELSHPEDCSRSLSVPAPLFALAFSPESDVLAASYRRNKKIEVKLFNLRTGNETLIDGESTFSFMAVSGEGASVAIPTVNHSMMVKGANGDTYGESPAKHLQDVSTVAITEDGFYAASGSGDGTVRVMEVQGRAVSLVPAGSAVQSVAFTQMGDLVLISGNTIRKFNVLNRSDAFDSVKVKRIFDISPFGRYLTAFDSTVTDADLEVINHMMIEEPKKLPLADLKVSDMISRQSVHYTLDEEQLFITSPAIGLIRYGLKDKESKRLLYRESTGATSQVISGNGQTLVWTTDEGSWISRLDSSAGRSKVPIPDSKGLAVNADGTLLAVAGTRPVVVVYNTATWKEAFTVSGMTGADKAIFSPDGRYLAVAWNDKRLSLCDVRTGTILWQDEGRDTTLLLFSNDGKMLVTGGGLESQLARDIHLIETATNNTLLHIQQQTQPFGVAIDLKGRYLEVLDATSITRHYLSTTDLIAQTCRLLKGASLQPAWNKLLSGRSHKTCPDA